MANTINKRKRSDPSDDRPGKRSKLFDVTPNMANINNKRKRSDPNDKRPGKQPQLSDIMLQISAARKRDNNTVFDVTPNRQQLRIARKNQQRSPLLRLPREVRDLIWSFVFPGNKLEYDSLKPPGTQFFVSTEKLNLSTLQVSRQVYSETRFLPWQQNLFSFTPINSGLFWMALRWMHAPNREQICRIRIVVHRYPLGNPLQYIHEDLKDIRPLLPNLKHITMSPDVQADVDGSDFEKRMAENVRVTIQASKQIFPDIEYAIEGYPETVSERTRLAVLGMDIE